MDIITNQFIPNQFPETYQERGPVFIAFMQAYYEWLSQTGNALYNSRNLQNYGDIDLTQNAFISHFKNEYMDNLPANVVADQRLLIKHIIDLYRSKGSKRGYELLFRILFNEDISFYLPGEHLFKPSDNQWTQQAYIEVGNSPYLANLVGTAIYSSSTLATALVEDYNVVTINNKVINVLTISNVNGVFRYGEFVLSKEISALNLNNAPEIVGSLSAISINNGGAFFNVGDIVNVSGSGSGGIARVAAIQNQSGKVIFALKNGGFGFTVNAQVTVSGGGGAGATFSVGSLVNETIMLVNLDIANNYYNTQLDIDSEGFTLTISNTSASFQVGEVVTSSANGIGLDFAYISGNNLSNGEILSNTSLGINNLKVIEIDNPSYVNLTGPESALNNANLIGGIFLSGATSGDIIYVNSVIPKVQYNANGYVVLANSTSITIDDGLGYFLPTSNLHGTNSGANAYINITKRNTNWSFPVGINTNLDTAIDNVLTYETLVIGTIASLKGENPGALYGSNPSVSILEPLIYQLQLPDGVGGFWGGDANVTATALNANGVITALSMTSSGYGYQPNESLTIYSNNVYIASGTAVVDGTGISPGYWNSNKSFVSDENYIQDSYYYQEFSYEVSAPRMLSTYQAFLNSLVHPVGYQMFGKFLIQDTQISTSNTEYYTMTQTGY
jgi:hypothetical protein